MLIVGAGGLGSPVAFYLAAAGVGRIGIADDDVVSLSNLQRQILHANREIGAPKTASAARAMVALNPHIEVSQYPFRVDDANVMNLVAAYDIVVDGTDTFEARYLLSDACFHARKPLVTSGGVGI